MIDEKLIKELLIRGESSLGNFKPTQDIQYEEEAPSVIQSVKMREPLGKYKKSLKEQVQANPGMYTMMTPQGRMTVKEAIRKGYNFQTGEFDKPDMDQEKEKILGALPEEERKNVKRLTRPRQAELDEEEAEEMGIEDPANSMVKRKRPLPVEEAEAPMEEAAPEGEAPVDAAALQALLGGGM
jgi:hypothetical protein